jgi:hypothetical protein
MASNQSLIIASGYDGLFTIDTTGRVQRFIHDPFDSRSIISSSTHKIFTGSKGEVIIGTITSGLSMYNVFNSQVGF